MMACSSFCLEVCWLKYEKNFHNSNIQRRAIRCEFEPVAPSILKDSFGGGWSLLPTLAVGALLVFRQVERRFHVRESNREPHRSDLNLHCHLVVQGHLRPKRNTCRFGMSNEQNWSEYLN